GPTIRPSSPTRSNSTSSIATQASFATPIPATIINNPTLVSGALPSVTASFTSVPMTTPPQTPRSTTGSVSGIKRDASESEKEDGSQVQAQGQERKRRRIAPTRMVGGENAA
ncbi:hypothetical protein B7494_g8648, partial [Chlorociboria aeruginascens]